MFYRKKNGGRLEVLVMAQQGAGACVGAAACSPFTEMSLHVFPWDK